MIKAHSPRVQSSARRLLDFYQIAEHRLRAMIPHTQGKQSILLEQMYREEVTEHTYVHLRYVEALPLETIAQRMGTSRRSLCRQLGNRLDFHIWDMANRSIRGESA